MIAGKDMRDICDNRCNNFNDPCKSCIEASDKEEKNAASREREKNLAKRAAFHQITKRWKSIAS